MVTHYLNTKGKGVVCKIEKAENMPVDKDGNRADIVIDPTSTISRINIGRLYEHYINGVSRDIVNRVRTMLGIDKGKCSIDLLYSADTVVLKDVYNYMLSYFEITCTKQYEFYKALGEEDRYEVINNVINDDLYTYLPVNNPKSNMDIVQELEAKFDPTYDKVSYVGNSGKKVVTKSKVRIAPMYIMALDKIADDWSAVSSGRLQHFGILSPIIKSEKFALPFRNSPVRSIGETESRIYVGYCGEEAMAEMMDRSNNPLTQRNMTWNILNADKPTKINNVVDRNLVPLGGSKPIQLVKHMLTASGFTPVYEPED